MAFVAIIIEEMKHQRARVANALPQSVFLIERRTFPLLLQLLVISLKVSLL